MNNRIYKTLLLIIPFLLLVKHSKAQKTEILKEAMVSKIISNFSVSKERAIEIHSALDYKQEEVKQMLSGKTLSTAAGLEKFLALVAECQLHIEQKLTVAERAKIVSLMPAETAMRKAAAAERIRMKQNAPFINKKN